MICADKGEVALDFYVLGSALTPVYMLDGERPVLFDGGMAHLAPRYIEDARDVLKGRQPSLHLHTHMHFDHCGSSSALKRAFPAMKTGSSPQGAEIIARPNARELIARLCDEAREGDRTFVSVDPVAETFTPFEVELVVNGGDVLDLGGGQTLKVYATPGHTRDFLAYYNPERGILIASEAAGCAHTPGRVNVEFVSDYDSYLESLKFLASLKARIVCQGHLFVYLGEDAEKFFADSIRDTEIYRERAERLLTEEKGDVEAVVQRIKVAQWDRLSEPKQPLGAYLLNTRARVRNLAARLGL